MDRNGKKPKARRTDASRLAERSDMKASARDVLGRTDAAGGAKGAQSAQGAPATPGRKGHRG